MSEIEQRQALVGQAQEALKDNPKQRNAQLKMQILTGPCATCTAAKIKIRQGGKVSIECDLGFSPKKLFTDLLLPVGETPECIVYEPLSYGQPQISNPE